MSVMQITHMARSLRLAGKVASLDELRFDLTERPVPAVSGENAIVEVYAAGVNPSDVKAALGMMPYAVFPRTPGRDFAGVVVDGPPSILGTAVFGSSGDLGIRCDGSHATHVVIPSAGLVAKPEELTMEQAAGLGVPFVTAVEGFRRSGMPQKGETVLILGANGRVGQAAIQIARWYGARVIGVARRPMASGDCMADHFIDSSVDNVSEKVLELTGQRGAEIIFNTVGEPYYTAGIQSAALKARVIFIASFKQPVEFDIFAFYRRQLSFVGIDTLSLSSAASAERLRGLLPGFACGALVPFEIHSDALYTLGDALSAYKAVMEPFAPRILFSPKR